MIKISFHLKLELLLLVLIVSVMVNAQTKKVALDGSFLTGDLCGFWNDERWQQEFFALKNAGMHYVIIQAVADSYPQRATFTIYPSSLPNTEVAKGVNNIPYPDIVDACLRNAESAGIKVFLGIDFNKKWWDLYASDSTWLYSQMDLDNNICDELWDNYKSKYPNAFYGWYWSYEVDNLHFTTREQQKVLTTAMNKQLDHLISSNEKLPFMWCPFMNSKVGNPKSYEAMWENVFADLHTTEGDIFCPQDGVGAGGLKLEEIAQWFSALRKAVDTKPGLKMWSDVETFRYYNNSFIAATIDRLISQLEIEQPYVDNYISWEYSYYYSPYKSNPGFHTTYLDYLENNSIENLSPTSPQSFVLQSFPGSNLLSWEISTDNIGICGYNIYRNGKKIIIIQGAENSLNNTEAASSTLDVNIEPNSMYSYQVEAYDFAGNVSELTSTITVKTENYEIVSLGCPYSVSLFPSNIYPDTHNKELTDGRVSLQTYFINQQWVGFSNVDTLVVTIDLKQNVKVKNFTTNYLLDPQPAIYLPKHIGVSISTDNIIFNDVGTMKDITPHDSLTSKHMYYCTLPVARVARYVKFSTIAANKAWLFVDEYQVFGTSVTDISDNSQKSFNEFYLTSNYPNPFNPTTVIEYSIPKIKNKKSIHVQLKIFDVLGKEIAILVNEKQKPGNYSINFNASNLDSGIYFYRLYTDSFSKTRKMVLVK
jgi:hypothetical protein